MRLAIFTSIFLLLGTALAHADSPAVDAGPNTLFLLQADPAKHALLDRTGRFNPLVTGGKVVDDPTWGSCLLLGDLDKTGITLKDDGKINFAGGFTLDAWVQLDELPAAKGASFAMKVGSFSWDITAKGKLNTSWLVFPSEEIFTTAPGQFKYYPVGGDTINGLMQVPLKKWVRITLAYDEALGSVTNRIDGMIDRQRYRYRGAQQMKADGRSPFQFLQGFKNCRVGAIRLNRGRPKEGPPSLEVYVNQLPYQDRVMLTFDHIDPDLPLPMEATIVFEKPNGEAATVRTVTLDSHAKKDVMINLPTWKNAQHTVMVSAQAKGKAVFARTFRIASVKPAGPVKIELDRSLSKDGKKFFPLMVYHAMPEDFPLLAKMGFHVILNDFNLNQHTEEARPYNTLLKESLDAAQQNNLTLWTATNSHFNSLSRLSTAKGHPGLLGWYGADEPWGDLTRLLENYNTTKMLEPNLPILIIQNNYSRLQDSAPGADIIGTDPYPIPNVSLRAVVDATQAAVRSVSGQKPVWTVLPQYHTKVPTRDELRCMAWLAIISGADGLGIFDWDERTRDKKTKEMKGWYTKDHPEAVDNLRFVLKELRSLENVLLATKAEQQPTMKPANLALHALVKEAGGKRYLLVANDSRRAEETSLSLPSVGDATAINVGDIADENLRITQGEVRITMPPLGVRIFEISKR